MSENVKILKSKTFDFGIAELRSDNILAFTPNEKMKTYTIPILNEMLTEFRIITEGIPRPYFCDNTKIVATLGNEEKKYITEHFHEFASVFAMTENSPITRFVAHTVMYIYKPKVPMKMFKDKESAINWLNLQQ